MEKVALHNVNSFQFCTSMVTGRTLHRLYVFIFNKVSDITKHSVPTGCQLKIEMKWSLCLQQTTVRCVSTKLTSTMRAIDILLVVSWWHNVNMQLQCLLPMTLHTVHNLNERLMQKYRKINTVTHLLVLKICIWDKKLMVLFFFFCRLTIDDKERKSQEAARWVEPVRSHLMLISQTRSYSHTVKGSSCSLNRLFLFVSFTYKQLFCEVGSVQWVSHATRTAAQSWASPWFHCGNQTLQSIYAAQQWFHSSTSVFWSSLEDAMRVHSWKPSKNQRSIMNWKQQCATLPWQPQLFFQAAFTLIPGQ